MSFRAKLSRQCTVESHRNSQSRDITVVVRKPSPDQAEVSSSITSRPFRMPAAERRAMLISRAITCFSQNGFHATSMEEIATASGITKPVIYQHFNSKRDLFVAALWEVGRSLSNAIHVATLNCATPRERVEKGFEAYFRFVCEHRVAYELMFASAPRRDRDIRELVVEVEEGIADLVTTEIEVDIDPHHRRYVAVGVLAIAEGSARRFLRGYSHPDTDPSIPLHYESCGAEQVCKQMAELVWAGLRGLHRI